MARGHYFGYPQCCIDAFPYCEDETAEDWGVRHDVEVNQLSGFIPCAKHARMIKEGKIKLSDLIADRVCPTPFPLEDE